MFFNFESSEEDKEKKQQIAADRIVLTFICLLLRLILRSEKESWRKRITGVESSRVVIATRDESNFNELCFCLSFESTCTPNEFSSYSIAL